MRGIRNFIQVGVGGVLVRRSENSLDNVFFFFFIVLNLFYSKQRGSNGFIKEKTILFKGSTCLRMRGRKSQRFHRIFIGEFLGRENHPQHRL